MTIFKFDSLYYPNRTYKSALNFLETHADLSPNGTSAITPVEDRVYEHDAITTFYNKNPKLRMRSFLSNDKKSFLSIANFENKEQQNEILNIFRYILNNKNKQYYEHCVTILSEKLYDEIPDRSEWILIYNLNNVGTYDKLFTYLIKDEPTIERLEQIKSSEMKYEIFGYI
jgi:hypothetical protein